MIYVFGDCELDTHLYELRRGGGDRFSFSPEYSMPWPTFFCTATGWS